MMRQIIGSHLLVCHGERVITGHHLPAESVEVEIKLPELPLSFNKLIRADLFSSSDWFASTLGVSMHCTTMPCTAMHDTIACGCFGLAAWSQCHRRGRGGWVAV